MASNGGYYKKSGGGGHSGGGGGRARGVLNKMFPFGSRIFGSKASKKDLEDQRAQQQYYGGSEEAMQGYQDKYARNQDAAATRVNDALQQSGYVQDANETTNAHLQGQFSKFAKQQQGLAGQARQGFDQSAQNYGQARDLVLGSANELAQNARNAPGQFMQTDQAQFQAQQDANQRAALALGATGGAGGLRSALATSAGANSAASQQANITRANQFNQLMGLQQQGLAQAAGLQSGVGAQDQGMAGLQSNRQLSAYGQQANAYAQQGNLSNSTAQIGLQSANMGVGAGLTTQGQYLGAEQGMNTAQLAGNQAYDALRQQDEKRDYDNKWRPLKRIFGGAFVLAFLADELLRSVSGGF